MLKVGDTVKVIAATASHCDPDDKTEYIPIGTICKGVTLITVKMEHIMVFSLWNQIAFFTIWKMSLKKDIWNGLKTNES